MKEQYEQTIEDNILIIINSQSLLKIAFEFLIWNKGF